MLGFRITTVNAKLSKIACLSGEEFISHLRRCSLKMKQKKSSYSGLQMCRVETWGRDSMSQCGLEVAFIYSSLGVNSDLHTVTLGFLLCKEES